MVVEEAIGSLGNGNYNHLRMTGHLWMQQLDLTYFGAGISASIGVCMQCLASAYSIFGVIGCAFLSREKNEEKDE